jgi:hypothetical protein
VIYRRVLRGALLAAIIGGSAACSSSSHHAAKTTPTTVRGAAQHAGPPVSPVNVDYASLSAWCHRVHSLYSARDTTQPADLEREVRALLQQRAAIEYRGKITTAEQAATELKVVNQTCTTFGR